MPIKKSSKKLFKNPHSWIWTSRCIRLENQISARFRPIFDFELKWKRSRAELSWKSFSSSCGSSQLGSDSSLLVITSPIIVLFLPWGRPDVDRKEEVQEELQDESFRRTFVGFTQAACQNTKKYINIRNSCKKIHQSNRKCYLYPLFFKISLWKLFHKQFTT